MYKIFEQGLLKTALKNREKADKPIVFNQNFRMYFGYWKYIAFFPQSLGNTPSSSIDRSISFNGIAIVLSHSLIFLINTLFYP